MEAPPINVTDVVIALVILSSGLFAFFRGFVHELLAVISWIGAALATLYGFPYLQPHVRELITVPLIADMTAGVAIFLVVLIALSILTRILSHRIRTSALGPLDRALGLVFGFLRGAALVCIAWLIFAWLLPREDYPEWITEAKLRPLVERGSVLLATGSAAPGLAMSLPETRVLKMRILKMRIVRSEHPAARRLPSGVQARERTRSEPALRVASNSSRTRAGSPARAALPATSRIRSPQQARMVRA